MTLHLPIALAAVGIIFALARLNAPSDTAPADVIVDTPPDPTQPANPDLYTMRASENLLDMLRKSEGGPLLVPTNLGDGGWTIGYGRFARDRSALPERITPAEAEAMFRSDVDSRGAYWVRRYVAVTLSQEQFDALTSMAYNLSPRSFKTIADAINAGESPDDAALKFTLPGSRFSAGLRARRQRELALYHFGTYA